MKNAILYTMLITMSAGCASNESKMKEVLKNNPNLIFDAIEQNPVQFIEIVNRAAKKAQQEQYEKLAAKAKSEQDEDLKNPKQPELSIERRLTGDSSGKMTIVEYADFQCPACKMAFDSLKEFKNRHAGEIQFYFKNMPLDFHKMAYPAALYFEAVRLQDNRKAAKFYDYVFQNQQHISENGFLRKAAKLVGANLKKVDQDIESAEIKKILASDAAEFEKFKFTGTPVIILNGVALNGAPRVEDLERIAKATSQRTN